jgi:hypothetical protein
MRGVGTYSSQWGLRSSRPLDPCRRRWADERKIPRRGHRTRGSSCHSPVRGTSRRAQRLCRRAARRVPRHTSCSAWQRAPDATAMWVTRLREGKSTTREKTAFGRRRQDFYPPQTETACGNKLTHLSHDPAPEVHVVTCSSVSLKGRVRFPKRTRLVPAGIRTGTDRSESAEYFFLFFWKGGALQRDAEVESF